MRLREKSSQANVTGLGTSSNLKNTLAMQLLYIENKTRIQLQTHSQLTLNFLNFWIL